MITTRVLPPCRVVRGEFVLVLHVDKGEEPDRTIDVSQSPWSKSPQAANIFPQISIGASTDNMAVGVALGISSNLLFSSYAKVEFVCRCVLVRRRTSVWSQQVSTRRGFSICA